MPFDFSGLFDPPLQCSVHSTPPTLLTELELKMPAIRAFAAPTESRTAPIHARKLSHGVRVVHISAGSCSRSGTHRAAQLKDALVHKNYVAQPTQSWLDLPSSRAGESGNGKRNKVPEDASCANLGRFDRLERRQICQSLECYVDIAPAGGQTHHAGPVGARDAP
jgi:hypothetical protein